MKKFLSGTIIFFSVIFLCGQENESNPFVIPENIKDNVAFWNKIYTEISITEGLLHDRECPMIIYKKVTIGGLEGKRRSRLIRKHIKVISHSLFLINNKPQSRCTEKEKQLVELFKKYGAIEDMKSARKRIRFQQGQKEQFKLGVERSGAYLDYIFGVFKNFGIPRRIAYLPHVESSFNHKAYSRVGASGMWQFMRRTGRLFLEINYKIDERQDPFKSTVAAAKLLKKNYEELKSWPLAITAYNHGLESIKRAVRLTGKRDIGLIVEKYKNRRFRFASKNFYSCFLVASEIGENPLKYFSDLSYYQPMKYNVIELNSNIRSTVLSKYLGISQDEIAKLNPSLRSTVFRRQLAIPRGFQLRIPASLSPENAIGKIAAIPGSLKSSKPKDFLYYSVKRGDSLYRISRKFRISYNTLLAVNNIYRKNLIYIGQVLRIQVVNDSLKKNKSINTRTAITTPKESNLKTASKKSTTVQKESPSVKIKSAETFSDPTIRRNKKGNETFDSAIYNLDIDFFPQKGFAQIRVSVDETLGHYADWLGISTSRIRRLNRAGRRSIKVNQKILVPIDEDSIEQFKTRRLEYHMALEEDFYNQYRVVGSKVRKIKFGETLWSICNGEKEIPLWLFKKYNNQIDIEKIRKNAKISLPVIKDRVAK